MDHGFAGRTALVTGGGRNIGRAIALAFADAGANVGLIGRSNREQIERVAQDVRSRGVKASVAMGDIGDSDQVERMVGSIRDELGMIHYLVNNAARRPRQAFGDISVRDWQAVVETNLSSIFYFSRLLLPSMAADGFGRVVTIGGPDGSHAVLDRAHNVTCKAGLIGLTKAIALEFGNRGVTANIVVPGIMDTERDPVDYPNWDALTRSIPAMRERGDIAVPRTGACEEVAHAVMFFASRHSSYITLQQIHVSGGLFSLP